MLARSNSPIRQHAEELPKAERSGEMGSDITKLLHAVANSWLRSQRSHRSGTAAAWVKLRAQLAYLARTWCDMKAIEIARQLNRDPSMVSRLCASYEGVRDLKTEKKIADVIHK
jgi:hypothetical protein